MEPHLSVLEWIKTWIWTAWTKTLTCILYNFVFCLEAL